MRHWNLKLIEKANGYLDDLDDYELNWLREELLVLSEDPTKVGYKAGFPYVPRGLIYRSERYCPIDSTTKRVFTIHFELDEVTRTISVFSIGRQKLALP